MKKRFLTRSMFLKFFFVACACLMCAMPAWADITLRAVDQSFNPISAQVAIDDDSFSYGEATTDVGGEIALCAVKRSTSDAAFVGFYDESHELIASVEDCVMNYDDEMYYSYDVEAWDGDETFYAVYEGGSSGPATGPATYYARVNCVADSQTPRQGAYGLKYGGSRTSDPILYTSQETRNAESETGSATIIFPDSKEYSAVPLRGYKFSSWTLMGTNASKSTASSFTNDGFRLNIVSSSTDENNPETATLRANYTTATEKTITLSKASGQGTIIAKYHNFHENDAHTGLEIKEITLGTMGVAETNVVYDVYETDTILLTAVPAEGYKFNQWSYTTNNTARTRSTASFKFKVYNGSDVTYTATFTQLYKRYYAASATATTGGSVQVSWTDDNWGEATASASGNSWWTDATDTTVTAYFKATPAVGFEFVRWENAGTPVANADAEYNTTITATSTDSEAPTTLTLHAVFREISDYEAQVIGDVGGEAGEHGGDVVFTGSLADAYTNATAGNTIVLCKNVTLDAAMTINKNITINFNNYRINSAVSGAVVIPSGKTVTFEDNSTVGTGGIYVAQNTNAAHKAVVVNGTLHFMRGVISCENENTGSDAQATGVSVSGGATFNLMGGTVNVHANQSAIGVDVAASGSATLETGFVTANSVATAYGVRSDNATTAVAWNVAVNATVTGSADANEADGLRFINGGTNSVTGGKMTATASSANAKAHAIHVEGTTITLSENMEAVASAATASKAYALYAQGSTAVVTVQTGRFQANNTQDVVAVESGVIKLNGGYYTHHAPVAYMQEGVTEGDLASGKFYNEGYRYVLSNGDNPNYVVATANGKSFSTLEDAILYANNNPGITMTILMKVPEYTLPSGIYTIPANATLLLPKDALQTDPRTSIDRVTESGSKPTPTVFQTLTLANGAHIDVFGAIEVGGRQHIYGTPFTGCPVGPYCSLIEMENGSSITLSNGANLYAWGFIQGTGTIDVRRGATVHEQLQISDFKGGSTTFGMRGNTQKAFPIMSYFIQNVEVKTTYRPGSHLLTYSGFVSVAIDRTKIIGIEGESAMFVMKDEDDSEDTWVRKWYDVAHDQQVYEINNAAKLSNLEIEYSAVTFNSADYDLPLSGNMKIHLLSGEMEIANHTVALPGVEIEVNKLSTVVIKSGKNVSLLDADQWGPYLYNNALGRRIKYRPGGVPTVRDFSSTATIPDAQMNIHGTLDVKGALYTSASGANIFSTNADAGMITFTTATPSAGSAVYMVGTVHPTGEAIIKYGADYTEIETVPALLTNAADQTSTSGLAAGTTYCYINNAWHNFVKDDDCFVSETVEEVKTYYAKPQDYVALENGDEDENHLYYSSDHSRIFILTLDRDGNCQWWEVEDVAGHPELKHSIHPDNDVYYYYYDDPGDDANDGWKEKRFTITWKNWDGATIETYTMKMGATLQYLGSTPSREKNDYYTYDFAGWSPAIAANAVVTGDATYTAQFNQTDRKYLITFMNGGDEIETQYLKMGEIPECKSYVLSASEVWSPALSAVTGDATYQVATNGSGPYTIRFVNWNGDELQSNEVANGDMPAYSGATPIKPAIGDENYTFIGWTPNIVAATADAVYMATFEAQEVTGLNITNAQTITDNREVTDLRVTTTGALTITGDVTANNFILESDGSTASGQFMAGYENLHFTHAYFDMKLNAKNHKWYAVAVPWPVDAEHGISVNGRTLTLGTDFDIIYYNGARRAVEGKNKCWSYVEDDGDRTLVPGRLYMIGLMIDAATVRFEMKDGEEMSTTTTSVTEHNSANATDAGWNGVANPALFHAFINPGVAEGQVYNPDSKSYSLITLNTSRLVVGEGAFVQAPASIAVINAVTSNPFSAPRRTQAHANLIYDVRIAPAEADYTDRLFVKTTDSKEAEVYTVGEDLAKVGVSSLVPQMWINRYGEKLCVNTQELRNYTATYPLGISVPTEGDYTINVEETDSEHTLYLTLDGRVIWNLSMAPYTYEPTLRSASCGQCTAGSNRHRGCAHRR